MPVRVRVQVEGMRQLQRRLRAEPLMGEPLRQAFEGIGRLGVAESQRMGPVDTGTLRASAVHKVGGGPVAKNVRIRFTAKSRRGYRYPGWLAFAPRSPHKGWTKRLSDWLHARAVPELTRALREIEARWRR